MVPDEFTKGAVLAYGMQMLSFLILRRKLPNAKRPRMSPWGLSAAIATAVISAIFFLGFLLNEDFRVASITIVAVYSIALLMSGL